MSDIVLTLDGAEPEVVAAALAHYQGFLIKCAAIGGDAADIEASIRPVVSRVAARLAIQMYDGAEPDWDLAAGDHFAGMPS